MSSPKEKREDRENEVWIRKNAQSSKRPLKILPGTFLTRLDGRYYRVSVEKFNAR